MNVMTVTGSVDIDELGVVLPHEHIISAFDWPGLWPDVSHCPELVWKKVTMELLGELKRNYCAIRDNCILNDTAEAIKELEFFKKAGGSTIMEMSTQGLFGDPLKLREISLKTGVLIIAGTGYYLDQTFSEQVKKMSIEKMYESMMQDITIGFPGTDVKAGIIGEVGISNFSKAEENSLRASVRVQKDTGLAINIHVGFSPELSRKAIKILKEEKADFKKIAFAHCDGNSIEFNRELANEGIYVEADCFGNEWYVDNGAYDGDSAYYFNSDGERVKNIKKLIDAGFVDKIFLSQDICTKTQTIQYGGYGYAHLLDNIVPMLKYEGVCEEVISKIMVENPKRFLAGE